MPEQPQNAPGAAAVTVFLSFDGGDVIVRLPPPPGGPLADAAFRVGPGEGFAGKTYQELRGMGAGEHRIPDRSESDLSGVSDDELIAASEKLLTTEDPPPGVTR